MRWWWVVLLVVFVVLLVVFHPEAAPVERTITWTAVGDDGLVGTAAEYDIRIAQAPITEATWDQAEQLEGEPVPQPAGAQESYVVHGLEPGTTYYVALKTADEVPNWSALSNVLTIYIPDTTAPAAVLDLRMQE